MTTSQFYIAADLVILAAIAVIVVLTSKGWQRRLSTLAALAIVFVLAGLFFGENRLPGYGLLAIGAVLAIIDIFRRLATR
jgi:membrane-bound ClpP family serine protease